MADLYEVLRLFQTRVNAEPTVKKMLRDWDRRLAIEATDGPSYTVIVQGGQMVDILAEVAPDPDVSLMADTDVLTGIFTGTLNPMWAYNAGDLAFHGSTPDEMRLDAVVQYVWKT